MFLVGDWIDKAPIGNCRDFHFRCFRRCNPGQRIFDHETTLGLHTKFCRNREIDVRGGFAMLDFIAGHDDFEKFCELMSI